MYPMTTTGLATCYAMGLPFFRNALISDMLFTGAFFGLGYLLNRERAASSSLAA
jgi:hypothetical protein